MTLFYLLREQALCDFFPICAAGADSPGLSLLVSLAVVAAETNVLPASSSTTWLTLTEKCTARRGRSAFRSHGFGSGCEFDAVSFDQWPRYTAPSFFLAQPVRPVTTPLPFKVRWIDRRSPPRPTDQFLSIPDRELRVVTRR